MKLKTLHLFLILLGVLLLSNLGFVVKEGLEQASAAPPTQKALSDAEEANRDEREALDNKVDGDFYTTDDDKKYGPNGDASVSDKMTTRGGNRDMAAETLGRNAAKQPAAEGLGGDEYILKSSIVPPVCPKCPDASACPRQKPCPPCPACARCPEQPFTCKKVPDYNHADSRQLPKPVLANFASFSS